MRHLLPSLGLSIALVSLVGCSAASQASQGDGADTASEADGQPDAGGAASPPATDAGCPGHDAGSSPDARGASEAGDAGADALPPGTVVVTDLDDHLFEIANGGADHCTTTGGHDDCAGSCNGTCAGTKALSTYTVQTGVASPSTDGSSARVDVTGPGTDTLEWVKVDPASMGKGAFASATHFRWSLDFYPTTLDKVQAYEFDLFYGSNGWWLMMGTQCDLSSGNWNGWNQATGHWIPSSIGGCGGFFQMNAWNHIVFTFHRDPGSTGAATQYHYDSLEVNGVSHAWGLGGFNGSDNKWGDVVGVQVQQDLTSSFSGTLSSYYDQFTLEISP